MNNKQYRPGVGIVLIKPNMGIFAGKRMGNFANSWQMPQGGIDTHLNETAFNAAKRELFEETSVKSTKLIDETNNWLTYDIPKEILPSYWEGKYCGQRQKWFLMEFIGDDSEINTQTEDPEFTEWQWLDSKEIIEKIVPFKKELYIEIFSLFGIK